MVYLTFGSVIGHLPEAAGVFWSALDAVALLRAAIEKYSASPWQSSAARG
jgi:hypothetical protein